MHSDLTAVAAQAKTETSSASYETFPPRPFGRWLTVVVFALAMAWVESAVVFYLRTMLDRIEPYRPEPLPQFSGFALAELVREVATLVMLLTVGMLSGKTWPARLAYSSIAFGVWDIFYYAWLRVLCGWPHSLLDWDILFLIPVPWWGPVLAPMLIALLMIIWGSLVVFRPNQTGFPASWRPWLLNAMGMALALYVFMVDAWRAATHGPTAMRHMLPERFQWPLFVVALLLMAAPILNRWFPRRPGTSKALDLGGGTLSSV